RGGQERLPPMQTGEHAERLVDDAQPEVGDSSRVVVDLDRDPVLRARVADASEVGILRLDDATPDGEPPTRHRCGWAGDQAPHDQEKDSQPPPAILHGPQGRRKTFLKLYLWHLSSPDVEDARRLPTEAIPPASGELTTLADLVVMLKRELQAVEQRLVAECDAVEARDHFVDVRNRALTAVNRLGSLWQTGRLRSGTLAASEG